MIINLKKETVAELGHSDRLKIYVAGIVSQLFSHEAITVFNLKTKQVRNSVPRNCTARQCSPLRRKLLHGPSMFSVRAKIYEVLYNQSSSIAFL